MLSSGILLIDKPAGISSAGVLRHLQKRLGIDKIGHAGTLDPMATGLLVVLIENATRCAQFAEDGAKEYAAMFLWGKETSTDDIEGEVLQESGSRPTIEAIREALKNFIGTIDQVPPKISSIKIDGERAYKKARRGDVFEIPARKVTIESIKEVGHTEDTFECVVECGPGTYIRSIARDLGKAVGTLGTLQKLRRTKSFPFSVRDAKPMEQASLDDIISIERLFPQKKVLELDVAVTQGLQQGKASVLATLEGQNPAENLLLYRNCGGPILGILRKESPEKPLRIGCNFPIGKV
jgi:tRNA pseudouridine55 synthase